MIGKWKMTAACYRCGINIEDISPDEMLITSDRREFVVCPGCGRILYVAGGGDDMDISRMLKYEGKMNEQSIWEFICQKKEEGNRNAIRIMHEISKIRVKMNFEPLK